MAEGTQWQGVADQIRTQIARSELPPGAQITPEAKLAEEMGVSRATVRRALQALVDEGLITSGKGKPGRRVREKPELLTWSLTEYENGRRTDTHQADSWNQGIESQGKAARQDVVVLKEYATADVAGWLGVTENDLVTVRRRVRYADELPYQLSASYFPHHIAVGTALEIPGDQSAPGGILASLGHPQCSISDRIRGRMPTHNEASELNIAPGTPVIEHVRIGYDSDQEPIRTMVTIVPTDRWELRYDISFSEVHA